MRRFAIMMFGVAMALGLIEGSLRLASLFMRRAARPPAPRARPSGTLRILCLGESTTEKTSPDISWPAQLGPILSERLKTDVDVVNVGLSGTHTGYLLKQLPRQLTEYRPDLVVAMTGINDGYWFAVAGSDPSRGWRLPKVLRWAWHSLAGPHPPVMTEAARRWRKRKMDIDPPGSQRSCWNRLTSRNMTGSHACARAAACAGIRVPMLYAETILLLRNGSPSRMRDASTLMKAVAPLKLVHPRLLEAEAAIARMEGRSPEEERLLRRAIDLSPTSGWIYGDLIDALRKRKQYAAARSVFGMFRATGTLDTRPLSAMQNLCTETNDSKCVAALGDEMLSLVGQSVPGILTDTPRADTFANLRAMVKTTRDEGAVFVAMQYPRLDPRQLESIYKGLDVPIISNADNFEEALARGGYDDYFIDRFRGHWGHATKAGNRLIAERLASELIARGLTTPRR